MFKVFHRTFWKANPAWPNGLEPSLGRKIHIDFVGTEDEARDMCREWSDTHPRGKFSDKAEYEEV